MVFSCFANFGFPPGVAQLVQETIRKESRPPSRTAGCRPPGGKPSSFWWNARCHSRFGSSHRMQRSTTFDDAHLVFRFYDRFCCRCIRLFFGWRVASGEVRTVHVNVSSFRFCGAPCASSALLCRASYSWYSVQSYSSKSGEVGNLSLLGNERPSCRNRTGELFLPLDP